MTSAVREVLLCYGYLSCKQASTEETTGIVPIALTSIHVCTYPRIRRMSMQAIPCRGQDLHFGSRDLNHPADSDSRSGDLRYTW